MGRGQKKSLNSRYGKLRFLAKNPRRISDSAMQGLMDSIDRDSLFMVYNKITIDENCVILGGNQRARALLAMGYDSVPDEWIVQALHEDGTPLTDDEKERLSFILNSPEGISGEFDYAAMVEGFSFDLLRDVGIDLSKIDMPEQDREEFEGRAAEEVETSEVGEESEVLKDLHRKRDESKKKFEDMSDMAFYGVLVFQNNEQRLAFTAAMEERGVPTKYHGLYLNGEKLAEAFKIALPKCTGAAIRERVPNAILQSMTLAGKDM